MSDYLSADAAVEALLQQDAPDPDAAPAPAPAAEAQDDLQLEAVPAAEGDPAPDVPASEDAPADPLEPVTAVEPPHFWTAEQKDRFAELPADMQAVVLEHAKNGERAVNQGLEKAAETRKAAEEAAKKADAEYANLTALNQRLGEVVPKAEEAFKSRWGHLTPQDWVALSRENPDQYVQAKAMFDAETADLQRLQDAKQDADKAEATKRDELHKAYIGREADALRTYAPELADPKTAKETGEKLVNYLKTALGVSPEEMPGVPAKALSRAGY